MQVLKNEPLFAPYYHKSYNYDAAIYNSVCGITEISVQEYFAQIEQVEENMEKERFAKKSPKSQFFQRRPKRPDDAYANVGLYRNGGSPRRRVLGGAFEQNESSGDRRWERPADVPLIWSVPSESKK